MAMIKKDYMAKRSQMRGKFALENYKSRWFMLTSTHLSYHDGTIETGVGKLKGQVALEKVIIVEEVDKEALHKVNAFQIVYVETRDTIEANSTLYIIAVYEQQMKDWIDAIRKACNDCGAQFFEKYHPGAWLHAPKVQKYSCCGSINKRDKGCQPVTCPLPLSPRKSRTAAIASPASDFKPSSSNPFSRMASQVTYNAVNEKTRKELPFPPTEQNTRVQEREDVATFGKVVALYDYQSTDPEDLSLLTGKEYDLLEEFKPDVWLHVRNEEGKLGHIPSNFVSLVEEDNLEQHDWFFPNTSRIQSESILLQDSREGCFLVRATNTTEVYSLSVVVARKKNNKDTATVKHYHIKTNLEGMYYLNERHAFETVSQLIYYHKHNAGGLVARPRFPPAYRPSPSIDFADTKEIDASLLVYHEELGAGQFGIVRKAIYDKKIPVAVKTMKEGTMSEDDFIDEAKIMIGLRHPNLVTLFGVYTAKRPLLILTEFMRHGALLHYLKKNKHLIQDKVTTLLDICFQVCCAMQYLEKKNYLHRDLAARNCLVGEDTVVKVADFGLARYVIDDEYTSSQGAKFPVKWSAPEVLSYTKFSSKSDVWSFGILMWEVFTCGETPYGKSRGNTDIINDITERNLRLSKPEKCPQSIFDIMYSCWHFDPDSRPSFETLYSQLNAMIERDNTNAE